MAIAGVLSLIAFYSGTMWLIPNNAITAAGSQIKLFGVCAAGLLLTVALVWVTEDYTHKLESYGRAITFDLRDPMVIIGLFIGGLIPYLL